MTVIEVMRTNRQHRRLRGKFDPLDAQHAALTVAVGRATATSKQRDGQVESLRIPLATVGDNPHRLAASAQFAALCEVAPIPASSGKTNRHRQPRGGDRQANRALHRIVLIRMRFREPRTMASVARRRAEGLADRDVIRCPKRHIANEIVALLTHPPIEPLPGPSLRRQGQALGIRLTDAADTLGVPYQRLRRSELGTHTDPDLVHRCQHWLEETDHQRLKTV